MTLFLVVDQISQIFPFFSQIFPIFAVLNIVFDPFLTRKTPFFTLFILTHASDNAASLNIGGANAWAVPPPQLLGDRPPVPPRSPPLEGEKKKEWMEANSLPMTLEETVSKLLNHLHDQTPCGKFSMVSQKTKTLLSPSVANLQPADSKELHKANDDSSHFSLAHFTVYFSFPSSIGSWSKPGFYNEQ